MIHVGDCLEVMRTLEANSFDSIVTDPPYHLTTGKKGGTGPATLNPNSPAGRSRIGTGFMGKAWDGGDIAFRPETWAEALRVAKPGAYLAAFGGTRTFHRLACAIEDAGWEIRDTLMWVYSSGFPKSHNLDRLRGEVFCGCDSEPTAECEVRPVRDADVSAPFDAGAKHGEIVQPGLPEQGASQHGFAWPESEAAAGEKSSLEGRRNIEAAQRELQRGPVCAGADVGASDGASGWLRHGASAGDGADVRILADANGGRGSPGPQPGEQPSVEPSAVSDERGSQARGSRPVCAGCGKPNPPRGLGTALKPAWEPIILARKPLIGTVEANWREHGTGALNIDGCRVEGEPVRIENYQSEGANGCMSHGHGGGNGHAGKERSARIETAGRWPANVVHDGSEEVLACFPDAPGQVAKASTSTSTRKNQNTYGSLARGSGGNEPRDDAGSAARFFYCAKASREDRNDGCDGMERRLGPEAGGSRASEAGRRGGYGAPRENHHPTVKPTALMRWLCRLVTPPGGLVLDPFTGSGSTGRAAIAEGMRFTGIELDPDYARIAEARIRAVQPGLGL